jgi:hypothetical protein
MLQTALARGLAHGAKAGALGESERSDKSDFEPRNLSEP